MLSAAVMEASNRAVQIDEEKLYAALDPIESVSNKSVIGGPAPIEVLRMKNERTEKIGFDEQWCYTHLFSLKKARSKLQKLIEEIGGGERIEG
jgi:hypothetical protein